MSSGSPSVHTARSSTTQKRIATAEADEAIRKMEMEMNVALDKKTDELSEWEKVIRRAKRNLNHYGNVEVKTLSHNDQLSYQNYVEEYEQALEEANAIKGEIERLHQTLNRRKQDIVNLLDSSVRKIEAIDENDSSCEGSYDEESVTSTKVAEEVEKWLSTTRDVEIPAPPLTSNIQAQAGWKRIELADGVITEQLVDPPNMGNNCDRRHVNYPPPPMNLTDNIGFQTQLSKENENQRYLGACGFHPGVQQTQRKETNPFLMDYAPRTLCALPQSSAPQPAVHDIVGQLTQALTQAFGSRAAEPREIIVKTDIDKELPLFYGDPGEFCNFQSAYQRSTVKYQFDADMNMARMHKALKGDAKKKVCHLMANPLNLNKLMQTLEDNYGRPEFVLDYLVEKVKSCERVELHKPETLVSFGDAVDSLVTNVCSYNKKDYMYNKQLTKELLDKLPASLKTRWFEWRAADDNRETNLVYFSEWIKMRVKAARLQITPKVKGQEDEKPSAYRRPKRGPATVNVAATEENEKKTCTFCKKSGHTITACRSFEKTSNREKWDFVKKERLCFLCLRFGHRTSECRSNNKCTVPECDKQHHTTLHYYGGAKPKKEVSPTASPSESDSDDSSSSKPAEVVKESQRAKKETQTTVGASVIEGTDGALSIVPVWLKGPNGVVKTYALLDTGASRSLLEEKLANELGLTGKDFHFSCRGFGGAVTKNKNSKIVEVDISGYYRGAKFSQIDNVITVEQIGIAPYTLNLKEAKNRWPCLRRIKGRSMKQAVPRIIIGSPHRHLTVPRQILCSKLGGPVATRTILGWVLEGDLNGTGVATMYYMGSNSEELDLTMHNLIKETFRTENFGITPTSSRHSIEDKKALQIMGRTTTKVDGRWQTGLLWRDDDITLPESFTDALKRLVSTERRMERDIVFREAYTKKMDEYLLKGFIRELKPDEISTKNKRTFYIPHFGVTNPNKPGKFRLVFDAAAKMRGVCLNGCLLTGPDLLRPLTSVLWNFRRHRIVIGGDIEDMFHRILIQKEDRPSQRFLWRDGDSTKQPGIYEMEVMIFGATSSPSSAIYVKDKNAEQLKDEFPEAYRAITEDFYMDDCLSGAESEKEAIKLRADITHVNLLGGFHIKKWISNSEAVMQSIPEDLRLVGARKLGRDDSTEFSERVLGLWWDPTRDIFTFKTNFHKVDPAILAGRTPTKREVCGLIMSLYDPLGFIGHYRVKGMIILQHIWNSGIGWDDQVPEDIYDDWMVWINEINCITSVQIPRCYCGNMKDAVSVELHTFTDASKEAYAAVSYFRFVFAETVKVSFISSKVKVAPLKKLTIPRLELQAAVLGAKLAAVIADEIKIKITKKYFWTDSRTVLSWVRSESSRHPEFVGNRIGAIQELSNTGDWRWVPTEDNVADDATRIKLKTDFSPESRWYAGGDFLHQDENNWPVESIIKEDSSVEFVHFQDDFGASPSIDDGCRLKSVEAFSDVFGVSLSKDDECGLKTGEGMDILPSIDKFSSYTRFVRVVVAVLRLCNKWLAKIRNSREADVCLYKDESGIKLCTATSEEIAQAEKLIIKLVQRDVFLQSGLVKKDSKMRQLCPYLDEDGILRARGRIDNSKAKYDSTRPIILPAKHHLTDLIIGQEHLRNAHTGQDTVLNNLRQKYWIINGRQAVKRYWTRCNFCRIQKAKPVIPEMGILPSCRLASGNYPFTFTGVDYFGPLEVTVGRRHEKRWGVIFCCLVSRAIHLEVSHGLSTYEMILALSRFVDSKRRPQTIFSDNGTNFHGAIRELEKTVASEKYKKIMVETGMEKINWRFIPPAAAHMGGAWERLIQAVKKVLKNVLHGKFPKDTVLMTAMKAAENIVNSRPMTYLSCDVDDPGALTPNHFIKCGVDIGPSIPAEVDNQASHFRAKWREAQALANIIWERWTKEYLPTLLRREKWTEQVEPIEVGDIVLILDDQVPRNCWMKAVVTSTFPAKDGHVRAVEVTTRDFATKKKSTLKRPVTKLCPLGLRMGKSAVMTSNLRAGNVGK